MTELILLLPYWLWALIIFFFTIFVSFVIGISVTGGDEDAASGCATIISIFLVWFSLAWFSDLYEETDLRSAQSGARNYELQQHRKWTNDSTSFLSERLSARKLMEEKVKEDTVSYSPAVANTIELLENRIRDYEFRTFALKDALIDSALRTGTYTKADAEASRKDYGIVLRRSTGIAEINPDDMSIKSINSGSPASEAGLTEGDIITEIIRHDEQDWKIMESNDITTLTGTYLYFGEMLVKIAPKKGIRPVGRIGIYMEDSFYAGTPAIKILTVMEDLPADLAGIMEGDLIVKINDSPLLSHLDFRYYFLNLDTIESTKLGIIRDGSEINVLVENILSREREYLVPLVARDIPYMTDETYSEWVKMTDALKLSLDRMKASQRFLYVMRKKNEISPANQDKTEEINKLILEAKKTADRNIKLFKLEENNE